MNKIILNHNNKIILGVPKWGIKCFPLLHGNLTHLKIGPWNVDSEQFNPISPSWRWKRSSTKLFYCQWMLIYSNISSNQQHFRKVSLASSFMKYLYGTPKLQTGAQKVGIWVAALPCSNGLHMQLRGKRGKKRRLRLLWPHCSQNNSKPHLRIIVAAMSWGTFVARIIQNLTSGLLWPQLWLQWAEAHMWPA